VGTAGRGGTEATTATPTTITDRQLGAAGNPLPQAILRRVRGTTIRTTYITGGLIDLTEEAVDYLLWKWGRDSLNKTGKRRRTLPFAASAGRSTSVR